MDDLCFFYSAKMVIVFILMLSSATLKAQRNEKDKFFDLMTAIGEDFGGEFNDTEKALELNLNGANSFLERLYRFATREIIRKNENGEFECKESKKPDFKMTIQTILGENMRNLIKAFLEKSSGTQLYTKKLHKKVKNLLKAITVPKQSDQIASGSVDSVKLSGDQLYTIKTILDDKSFKKVEDLLNQLFAPKKSDQIPSGADQIASGSDQTASGSVQIASGSDQTASGSVQIASGSDQIASGSDQTASGSDQIASGSDQTASGSDQIASASVDSEKFYSEEQLFKLFSLAARLEALVYGKNIDGTLKEKKENSKDKIQTFLAVSKCFILPEWESSIFDYWIEIIKMKTKPIFGVAMYKEKYNILKSEVSKERAFKFSKENYEILKQLNDQKFLFYESTNLLRYIFFRGYHPNFRIDEEGPQIFVNLLNQIQSVFYFNWEVKEYWRKNYKCAFAMFFQNVSESLMKMMTDKGIDPKVHLNSQVKEMREYVQKNAEKSCKKFENEEVKIIFLNNVHYELAINFEFNQREDVHDRV